MNSKAVFLDRDGVINRKLPGDGYVTRWEDMRLLPGIDNCIALLNRAGFRVFVVTNQRCVAKGLITSQALDAIHQQMCRWLATKGARVEGVYYCPHEKQPPCGCRKPAPGMLLAAARAYQVDLNASWMIGDSEIDVEAGRNAGCRTVRLWRRNQPAKSDADIVARSLLEAIREILRREIVVDKNKAIDVKSPLSTENSIVLRRPMCQ